MDNSRKWHREWMQKRRQEFFHNKVCVVCGSCDKLELDHIDPKDKIDHKIWSWSKERRELEQVKCQVLCNTCHKVKTKKDMGWDLFIHNATGYRNGCRCVLCREAQNVRTKEYRLRVPRKS